MKCQPSGFLQCRGESVPSDIEGLSDALRFALKEKPGSANGVKSPLDKAVSLCFIVFNKAGKMIMFNFYFFYFYFNKGHP